MALRRELGALEREILARLTASPEPMSPSDLQAELRGQPAYTTIMTTLARTRVGAMPTTRGSATARALVHARPRACRR